jgi:hypothetical protein
MTTMQPNAVAIGNTPKATGDSTTVSPLSPSKRERQCAQCGKPYFYAHHGDPNRSKYCSRKCTSLARYTRVTRQCAYCSKNFDVHHYRAAEAKFCSRKCHHLAQRKKKTVKQCPRCSCKFYVLPSTAGQKYCSRKCWVPHNKIEKYCANCGKRFYVRPSKATRRFCSRKCSGLAHRVRVTKQCVYCSGRFDVAPSNAVNTKFCSRKCRTLALNTRSTWVTRQCAFCSKRFDVIPARADEAKFCSRKCYGLALRKTKLKKRCAKCGKKFHVPSWKAKQKFCSRKCSSTSKDTLLRMMGFKHDPLVQAKHSDSSRRTWSKQILAYDYLRKLLGAEMLDRLLEPVGKRASPRMSAAYTLLRRLSSEDLARLAIRSVSSNTGVA